MSLLPSKADLQETPLRALVAYAARCAQRVEPLFLAQSESPKAAANSKKIQKAIQAAMKFASGGKVTLSSIAKLEDQVTKAIEMASKDTKKDKAGVLAGKAAYAAINATHLAIQSLDSDDPATEAGMAAEAVKVAAESAATVDGSAGQSAGMDWVMLTRMDLGRFPMLGEPVDPSENGPLGPLFANFMMERQRLHAEQAQIEQAKEQLEPELAALREERQQLHSELEELRGEETTLREHHSAFQDEAVMIEKEKDQLRELALELKQVLSHWSTAGT